MEQPRTPPPTYPPGPSAPPIAPGRVGPAVPGAPLCPRCGGQSFRSGPWPWYLGTIGALLVNAVICNQCGHHFDTRKPHADLARRKRNLALFLNGIGLLGILIVLSCLVMVIVNTMRSGW